MPPHLPQTHRAGLAPPRFSLTGLLVSMAIVAGACGVARFLSFHGALLLVLLLLAAAAHVVGNVLGNQLRASGDRPLRDVDAASSPTPARQPPGASPTTGSRSEA